MYKNNNKTNFFTTKSLLSSWNLPFLKPHWHKTQQGVRDEVQLAIAQLKQLRCPFKNFNLFAEYGADKKARQFTV